MVNCCLAKLSGITLIVVLEVLGCNGVELGGVEVVVLETVVEEISGELLELAKILESTEGELFELVEMVETVKDFAFLP